MRISCCVVAVLAVLCCMQETARADLLEVDLDASGDALLTWDTATNLLWLDLTATTGESTSNILGSDWLTEDGFRYATVAEVATLFEHAAGGLTVDFANNTANNLVAVDELVDMLGYTGYAVGYVPRYEWGYGITGDLSAPGSTSTNRVWAAYRQYPGVGLLRPSYGNATEFHWGNDIGHFLVRAIPEPTTLALVGLGTLGIVALRRRKA